MSESFILVGVAQRRRLVRLSEVQEILSLMALVPVEGAAGSCRGMANLRGETLPVFDSGGPSAVLSPSRFVLVSRVDDTPIGLIVDEVHDVLTVESDRIKLRPIGAGRVTEVVSLDGELLTVLSPRAALSADAA